MASDKCRQISRMPGQNRLKIAFDHEVVTLGISAGATYEDIGRKLATLPKRRYGRVVAIYATFSPASDAPWQMAGVGAIAAGLFEDGPGTRLTGDARQAATQGVAPSAESVTWRK